LFQKNNLLLSGQKKDKTCSYEKEEKREMSSG